ncbi:hypothetical protein [Ferrimonas pelagia]|uniref:Uncharacterized protein n=1 Tax=Ferrimonas pelagia TaxID=1177826 RepID=A0ABP9EWT6_9GAMM
MAKYVSTSALAKSQGLAAKVAFDRLEQAGYLYRVLDKWQLTELGRRAGAQYMEHDKYGRYPVWPEGLALPDPSSLRTVRQLAKALGLQGAECIALLQELNWVVHIEQGHWVTAAGGAVGGVQNKLYGAGTPDSLWPPSLADHPQLRCLLQRYRGEDADARSTHNSVESFKRRYEAKYRTMSGHYVCTLAQLQIANGLYLQGVGFAFMRALPEQEQLFSDFYLPRYQLYIETGQQSPDEALLARIDWYHRHDARYLVVELSQLEQGPSALTGALGAMGIALN